MDFTPHQIKQLQSLGINSPQLPSHTTQNQSKPIKNTFPALPLLSLSGLTLISFGGLILLKSNLPRRTPNQNQSPNPAIGTPLEPAGRVSEPTQVPKSIQHYLLASQQHFSTALQQQNTTNPDQNQTIQSLNQAILSATQAVKDYPQDHRGFYQRARIYQSLADSQPQFVTPAINDLLQALKLNSSSAQITRDLASLFAKKGDASNTLSYLAQTIVLEPTKAQNFYDLAKLQQQTGQLPQALKTYRQLLPLVTDPVQIGTIKSEVTSLENLTRQNTSATDPSPATGTLPQAPRIPQGIGAQPSEPTISLPDDPSLIEANLLPTGLPFSGSERAQEGLIIAAPESDENQIKVNNLTNSNALSDTSILPTGQKQITLQNSNLQPNSQVYLSIISGVKNQTLRLISKSKNSFTVGLDNPPLQDIEFKWWIIN